MPVERADGKLTLGSGTIGLILAVVGAAWDYWIDGMTLGIAIFGIVVASIGMMMMATFIVKESTTSLNSTGLDLRILRKGGIFTVFGGISILIGLMIELMIKEFSAHDDERIQVGWSWWLMFVGVWILLVTGSLDLCNNYFPDDTGNEAHENGNEGIETEDQDNNSEVGIESEDLVSYSELENEMEDMIDAVIGNDRGNVVNEESQM